MAEPKQDLIDAATNDREVTLVTTGRVTGKPRRVTIWITTDGTHVYIRSGQGMKRDWPQNLVAKGEATLNPNAKSIKVRPRHVTDESEARETSHLARKKYGSYVKPSNPGEPLTKGEQAVFELLPTS
jgi:deazaflavin-dependent oxidoreductase (nitroreductase family)